MITIFKSLFMLSSVNKLLSINLPANKDLTSSSLKKCEFAVLSVSPNSDSDSGRKNRDVKLLEEPDNVLILNSPDCTNDKNETALSQNKDRRASQNERSIDRGDSVLNCWDVLLTEDVESSASRSQQQNIQQYHKLQLDGPLRKNVPLRRSEVNTENREIAQAIISSVVENVCKKLNNLNRAEGSLPEANSTSKAVMVVSACASKGKGPLEGATNLQQGGSASSTSFSIQSNEVPNLNNIQQYIHAQNVAATWPGKASQQSALVQHAENNSPSYPSSIQTPGPICQVQSKGLGKSLNQIYTEEATYWYWKGVYDMKGHIYRSMHCKGAKGISKMNSSSMHTVGKSNGQITRIINPNAASTIIQSPNKAGNLILTQGAKGSSIKSSTTTVKAPDGTIIVPNYSKKGIGSKLFGASSAGGQTSTVNGISIQSNGTQHSTNPSSTHSTLMNPQNNGNLTQLITTQKK